MITSDDQNFKKKREEFTINLRKTNRQQILMKKRNMNQDTNQQTGQFYKKHSIIIDESLRTYLNEIMKEKFDIRQALQLFAQLDSNDIIKKHRAVIGFRIITGEDALSLSNYILQKNLIGKLISLYNQEFYPQIKLELLWAFTNLTSVSTQFTYKLVQNKIISMVANDMINKSEAIQYHAIWTAGNIAADNTKYRDQLLLLGSIFHIIKFLQQKRSKNQFRTAIWSLTNLSRGNPAPNYETVKFAVVPIAEGLKTGLIINQQAISDCLWTLANLSQNGKDRVQRIAQTNVLQKVIPYMLYSNLKISIPAIRIVGNFTNGSKQQTNLVLKHNFFDNALILLDNPKDLIVKQICWAISNITAGNDEQMLQFLQRQDLIKKLLQIFTLRNAQIKTEIIWIFTNLQFCQAEDLILNLYEAIGLLKMISSQLSQTSQRAISEALICLYKVFNLSERLKQEGSQNQLVLHFCKLGYTPLLQALQKHESPKIYLECNKIMQRFFDVSEASMQDI